jgi:hypothetical protein
LADGPESGGRELAKAALASNESNFGCPKWFFQGKKGFHNYLLINNDFAKTNLH